jgi:hypothetical protein
MNFAVNRSSNRSSEFPSSPERQPSGAAKMPITPKPSKNNNSETQSQSSTSPDLAKERQHPIPPPSHPRQYRAIGLIRGKYQLSGEQLTQGTLEISDGTTIEAVLLGRVISLVKNHLDLNQNHLWVVYPRTKQNEDLLHVQIVGVWEPETLNKDGTASTETKAEPEDGYFSIRGEVIFYDREKEVAIVKIKQFPKKESDKVKFFKLKLQGTFPEKPIRHFWDLKVCLEGQTLKIAEANDLGMIPSKRRPDFRKGGGPGRKPYPSQKRPFTRPTPSGSSGSSSGSGTAGSRPIPKPNKPTRGNKPSKPEG